MDQLPLPTLSHGAEYSQFVVRNIARLNWLYSGPLCFVAKMVRNIAKVVRNTAKMVQNIAKMVLNIAKMVRIIARVVWNTARVVLITARAGWLCSRPQIFVISL